MLCNIKPVPITNLITTFFAKIPGGVQTPGPPLWIRPCYSTVSSSLPLQPIQVTHSVFFTPSPTNTGYSTVSSSLPLQPIQVTHSVFLTPSPTNTGYSTVSSSLPLQPIQVTAQCLPHSLSNQYRLHTVSSSLPLQPIQVTAMSSSLPLQPIQVTAQCLPHSLSNQYRLQHSVFLTPSPTNTGYSNVSIQVSSDVTCLVTISSNLIIIM